MHLCGMMNPEHFTLRNGVRVVFQPSDREVAHCGIMIGAGSRDEQGAEHGLAHFLEHCIFKGTKKRKVHHILTRLDAVGGELNAFTAKEETWIHASFMRGHLERASELISDIAFNAVFPAHEIHKEKEVILDEINGYKDSPADMIFEEFDALLCGNHPFGRSILGTSESLKHFGTRHLEHFRTRILQPEQIIFACTGNYRRNEIEKIAERYFSEKIGTSSSVERRKPRIAKGKHITAEKDIHQIHYVMGCEAYDYHHKKRPAFYLLNNLLGGPAMNSRLNMNIRERHGIAYQIDSSYSPFTDVGLFVIYLGTEKNNLEKSQSLIWKELNLFKNKKLSSRQLSDAKKQILGQMVIAQDSSSSLMFAAAKSLMVFDQIDTMEEVYARIEKISAEEIQDIAHEIFDESRMNSMLYKTS